MSIQMLRRRLLAAVNATEVSDDQIVSFFTANPQPTDDQIHQLAADHGLTPDELEDSIYRLFGKALADLRSQEASLTVTAAVELAAGETVPMRTVLLRAGGVGELRKLPANKALTLIRKAAGELSKERKAAGKTYQIDKEQLTTWIDENCAGKAAKPAAEKPAAKPVAKKTAPKKAEKPKPTAGTKRPTDMSQDEVLDYFRNDPEMKDAVRKLDEANKRLLELNAPGQSPARAKANGKLHSQLLKGVDEEVSKLRSRIAQDQQGTETKDNSKPTSTGKKPAVDESFADGEKHSKRVKIDKDGNLSVGKTKLIEKGKGFVLHWKDGDDEEQINVKSAADINKVGKNLQKDWAEWVKQHKAGDVTAKELKQVKEGYEEYVALLAKAQQAFAGASKRDLGNEPPAKPKPKADPVTQQQQQFQQEAPATPAPAAAPAAYAAPAAGSSTTEIMRHLDDKLPAADKTELYDMSARLTLSASKGKPDPTLLSKVQQKIRDITGIADLKSDEGKSVLSQLSKKLTEWATKAKPAEAPAPAPKVVSARDREHIKEVNNDLQALKDHIKRLPGRSEELDTQLLKLAAVLRNNPDADMETRTKIQEMIKQAREQADKDEYKLGDKKK